MRLGVSASNLLDISALGASRVVRSACCTMCLFGFQRPARPHCVAAGLAARGPKRGYTEKLELDTDSVIIFEIFPCKERPELGTPCSCSLDMESGDLTVPANYNAYMRASRHSANSEGRPSATEARAERCCSHQRFTSPVTAAWQAYFLMLARPMAHAQQSLYPRFSPPPQRGPKPPSPVAVW